ncbi:hypothetical protein AB0F30_17185 [Streptomyces sp. NPDC029006]|uniref:hypothetical protein n=1 Tax=Streptomyces sp. NPDC029006 TaxID=3155467 RepID=UPI0033CF1F26
MPRDELTQTKTHLRLAQQHAHRTDAERAEMEAQLHSAKAEAARANARAARTHAEAVTTQAALAEVRRLCDMTIADSIRVQAVQQARDTLAAIDAVTEGKPLPGDAAWHSVWLHGDWRWLTKNMTTAEREHAADAVARYSAHLNADDPDLEAEVTDLRWWRD